MSMEPGLPTELEGFRLFLDPSDTVLSAAIRSEGIWEPVETRFVRQQVRSGDVVVDAGAHIGYYACLMASLVGPKGFVYAFEPNPESYRFLLRNIRLNRFWNVLPIKMALWDQDDVLGFQISRGGNTGDSRVAQTGVPAFAVKACALDQYLGPKARQVDFLKSDTQGSEIMILRGAREVVASLRAMLVEWAPDLLLSVTGERAETLVPLLFDRFAVAHTQDNEEPIAVSQETLLRKPRGDVLCVRQ